MSYLLPHLNSGWAVDQAILAEEERLVVVRFGHDYDPTCMQMDEVLYGIAELVKNYSVIYLVDTTEVPDFNTMYELYDPCTVMFFFRNKVAGFFRALFFSPRAGDTLAAEACTVYTLGPLCLARAARQASLALAQRTATSLRLATHYTYLTQFS